MNDLTARRPIKSRNSLWAGACSRFLLKWKFTPNSISVLSVVFAALGAVCLYYAPRQTSVSHQVMLWLGAIAGIQLRLVCNLMDGLLAVEGGLKSPVGDLYNEVPDRIADVLLLVAAGYGVAFWHPWAAAAGWAAAVGAMATAYVRALGASLTGKQDFSGPFAKQHRMASLTIACFACLIEVLLKGKTAEPYKGIFFMIMLGTISVGTFITAWRRLRNISAILRSRAS